MSRTTCSKCHAVSGDDWAQCGGSCPMPGSPHYNPFARLKVGNSYRYAPRHVGARPACNVTLIASHPHDGACLIVEEIEPEDDGECYFSCEQSNLSEILK